MTVKDTIRNHREKIIIGSAATIFVGLSIALVYQTLRAQNYLHTGAAAISVMAELGGTSEQLLDRHTEFYGKK